MEFVRPPTAQVPELLFTDDECLVANCCVKATCWFMHTAAGFTANDGTAYRKLIRMCDRHRFQPNEPLPGGMRELSREEVSALWENYGRFNGMLDVARAQGFMVIMRDTSGAALILKGNWKTECKRVMATPVFVCEGGAGWNDVWTVEWVPAVQTERLTTPAGDTVKEIQEHARYLYGRLSEDRPWKAGKIDMDQNGFKSPGIEGFQVACQFALRVLAVEDTLRDPEMLMVSLVNEN